MTPPPGRIARTLQARPRLRRSFSTVAQRREELDHISAELHELLFARSRRTAT